jgi:steroid delta-isomerase
LAYEAYSRLALPNFFHFNSTDVKKMTIPQEQSLSLTAAIERFVHVMSSLRPDHLSELAALFTESARFKDPFNDVVGRAAIERVFTHGFKQCPALRFVVDEIAPVTPSNPSAGVVFFYWRFLCGGLNAAPDALYITGVSRVVFDAEGLVCEHVDFWDPAEQLYSRVPVLGGLMSWIRRHLSAR